MSSMYLAIITYPAIAVFVLTLSKLVKIKKLDAVKQSLNNIFLYSFILRTILEGTLPIGFDCMI